MKDVILNPTPKISRRKRRANYVPKHHSKKGQSSVFSYYFYFQIIFRNYKIWAKTISSCLLNLILFIVLVWLDEILIYFRIFSSRDCVMFIESKAPSSVWETICCHNNRFSFCSLGGYIPIIFSAEYEYTLFLVYKLLRKLYNSWGCTYRCQQSTRRLNFFSSQRTRTIDASDNYLAYRFSWSVVYFVQFMCF